MLPARTPKDRMFVLVTPDILEMDGTAHVLDAFLLNLFQLARLVLPAYLV